MGGMADDFRALRKINQERRSKNFSSAQDRYNDLYGLIKLTKHTDYHWAGTLEGKTLDYWPSSSRWRYLNKTHRGTVNHLIGFIKKRIKNPEQLNMKLRRLE